MSDRDEIVAGLKRWAIGSYPDQAAVLFLAATDEPLTRVWVKRAEGDAHKWVDGGWVEVEHPEPRYWLDWDAFDKHNGGLSGGEYATWWLARSLCARDGELNEHLWRLDPDRTEAFAGAIAHCRENWR